MDEWRPNNGPGFLTVEVDRKKVSADITRIKFDESFAPLFSMNFVAGLGGFGAIFDGWAEKENEYSKRWPMLRAGDARLAEVNSVTIGPKMTLQAIKSIVKLCVKPIRLTFWTNIRPRIDPLDDIAGQIGYAFDHLFCGLLEDMENIMSTEAELQEWFRSREKHFKEEMAKKTHAQRLQEMNSTSPPGSPKEGGRSPAESPKHKSPKSKTPKSKKSSDNKDGFIDKAAIAKEKELARQKRRKERNTMSPLEIDNENIARLQERIQKMILEFSGTVFSVPQKFPQLAHVPAPNFKDASQSTLLHHAVGSNNVTCVKFLLSMKADPAVQNATGVDALGIAIMRGRQELFDFFVDDLKVTLDQPDALGRTPLHTAARYGYVLARAQSMPVPVGLTFVRSLLEMFLQCADAWCPCKGCWPCKVPPRIDCTRQTSGGGHCCIMQETVATLTSWSGFWNSTLARTN